MPPKSGTLLELAAGTGLTLQTLDLPANNLMIVVRKAA